jgi:hypothetical protein
MIDPNTSISPGWFMLATTAIITVPPTINALVNVTLARRAEVKLDTVASKAAIVAVKVAEATAQQGQILVLAEKTHTLVNSQYGIALALIVAKSALIYEKDRTPENLDELNKAKEKLAEHEAKQHVVDSKEVTEENKP